MSQHEKRHFKLDSPKKLTLLFDAIEVQKTYDEEKIKKKFVADAYLGKQLSVAKNDLMKSLLKSLRGYNDAAGIESELKSIMTDADIFFRKGLYKMSYASIKRLKEISLAYEKWQWLHLAIVKEYRVLRALGLRKTTREYLLQLQQEEKELLKKIDIQQELSFIQVEMKYFYFTEGHLSKANATLKKVLSNPILEEAKDMESVRARLEYYQIKTFYYNYFEIDIPQAHRFSSELLKVMEEASHLMEDDVQTLIDILNAHVNSCIVLKKWNEGIETIDKIKKQGNSLPVSQSYVAYSAFGVAYVNQIDILNRLGEFEKAVDLIPEIEAGLNQFAKQVKAEHYLMFYQNLSYSCFGAGRYKESIKWLNKLFTISGANSRNDIMCAGHIMSLMVHYELGNEEIIPYVAKTAYRILLKNNKMFEPEQILLRFIRKELAVSIYDKKKLTESFKKLLEELKPLQSTLAENMLFDELHVITWLESKIENRPFAEKIKEKITVEQ
jgi:tetratricopeptide (TPR) repeat protein